jgi:hypothetical protein
MNKKTWDSLSPEAKVTQRLSASIGVTYRRRTDS